MSRSTKPFNKHPMFTVRTDSIHFSTPMCKLEADYLCDHLHAAGYRATVFPIVAKTYHAPARPLEVEHFVELLADVHFRAVEAAHAAGAPVS